MGADMYLNPPDPPRKDRVVVATLNGALVGIYGPYDRSQAKSKRYRLRLEDTNGTVYAVRKLED